MGGLRKTLAANKAMNSGSLGICRIRCSLDGSSMLVYGLNLKRYPWAHVLNVGILDGCTNLRRGMWNVLGNGGGGFSGRRSPLGTGFAKISTALSLCYLLPDLLRDEDGAASPCCSL